MTNEALPSSSGAPAADVPSDLAPHTPPGTPSGPTEEELLHGGKVMSVWDHLAELRSHLMKSAWAVVLLFLGAWYFVDQIIWYLEQPLLAVLPPGRNMLHFTGPLDVFLVNIKVALLTAVILACPVWLYQFWRFFEPALYPRERRYIMPFIIASVLLFAGGIAFCFYAILPMTLEFLIGMGMEVGVPIITIKDYVSLLILMLIGFGLVFETPVIIVLLALLDIVSLEALTSNRRMVFVAIVIIAAVATPSPDPISQMTLAIPVYAMYEIAIVIVRAVKKKQSAAPV